MHEYRIDPDKQYADSGYLGGLRLQPEQIAAIVEHSE